MIDEPFAMGDSLVHRFDPRLKIVFAVAFSFIIALSERFPTLTAGLGLSVFLLILSKVDFREAFGRIAIVLGFALMIWPVLPFTSGGAVLFTVGPLQAGREGVLLAARITLKSAAIFSVFIAFVATMNTSSLGHALNRLGFPEKIVHLLLMTYRYIFVIENEYHRLVRAAKIRGFQPGTNIHTYKTYAWLVGMIFVRSFERAERVNQAMRCRGFQGKFVSLYPFRITRSDVVFTIILFFFMFSLVLFEWTSIIPSYV